ncbi:VTT domain-containing protein [Klebsiella pneumoniae]|nr:VTT domain-containing protein [Klebsiella pneumoniae]
MVQRHGRGRALLLHRQSAGARSGGETHRPRGAAQCRRLFTRFGPQTILVCRLLPFVPFDPVSYAAGLTSLRFWPFMLATGVGQLPATIVYSWAGSLLTGGTFWLATGLSLLFALAVVISIAKNIYRERHKRSSP